MLVAGKVVDTSLVEEGVPYKQQDMMEACMDLDTLVVVLPASTLVFVDSLSDNFVVDIHSDRMEVVGLA